MASSGSTTTKTRGSSSASRSIVAYWRSLTLDPEGRRRIAVNIRLSEPESVAHLPIDHFDGLGTFTDLPRDGRCVSDLWF